MGGHSVLATQGAIKPGDHFEVRGDLQLDPFGREKANRVPPQSGFPAHPALTDV